MDMCHYFIGDTWHWRGIWRNLLKFLTEFDCRDRFVIIGNHKKLS
jgi:hypothetical protein